MWVNCCEQDALALEKLQLRVARAARHGCADLSDTVTLAQLNWSTLAWRRRLHCLLLFWKLVNYQGPPQLESLLPPTAGDRAPLYGFRKRQNIAFRFCATKRHAKSFSPAAIVLWSNLPAHIQSLSTVQWFRHSLYSYFCHDSFCFGLV